jgi:hypothetical protein
VASGEDGVRQLGAFLLYEGPLRGATTASPTSTSTSSSEWAWAEGQLSVVPRVQVEFRRDDKPDAPTYMYVCGGLRGCVLEIISIRPLMSIYRSQPVAFSGLDDRMVGVEQWSQVSKSPRAVAT